MQHAVKALEDLSADPKTQQLARDRETALVAYHHTMNASIEQGIEQGRVEGRVEGRRETLLELLTARFETLPEEFNRVPNTASEEAVRAATRELLTAKTLEEVTRLLQGGRR